MADVFISYKSERRPAVEHLKRVLENHGYSVWFDYGLLSGQPFARLIEREIRSARAVVVLWCELSIHSHWVLEEASLAKELSSLIPARIEETSLPFGYRSLDTIDLVSWSGDPRSGAALDRLLHQIALKVGRDPVLNYRALTEQQAQWWIHRKSLADFPLDGEAKRLDDERERQTAEALREEERRRREEEERLKRATEKAEADRVAERKRQEEADRLAAEKARADEQARVQAEQRHKEQQDALARLREQQSRLNKAANALKPLGARLDARVREKNRKEAQEARRAARAERLRRLRQRLAAIPAALAEHRVVALGAGAVAAALGLAITLPQWSAPLGTPGDTAAPTTKEPPPAAPSPPAEPEAWLIGEWVMDQAKAGNCDSKLIIETGEKDGFLRFTNPANDKAEEYEITVLSPKSLKNELWTYSLEPDGKVSMQLRSDPDIRLELSKCAG